MNRKCYSLILILTLGIVLVSSLGYADKAEIYGEYCYHYGDSESLYAAKEISYAMALRSAIETHQTFVSSTSIVEDFQVKKDLLETVASGYVEDIKIIKREVIGRTVCTSVVGYVNPNSVRKIIARKIEKVSKVNAKKFEGLVKNSHIKILNYKREVNQLLILYQIKSLSTHSSRAFGIKSRLIVNCFDEYGNTLPTASTTIHIDKGNYIGEVRKTAVILPRGTLSFELRLEGARDF